MTNVVVMYNMAQKNSVHSALNMSVKTDHKKPYPDDIAHFLKRIYVARGVDGDELNLSLRHLLPAQFKNLAQALQRLTVAIERQQRILIVADFDADGATACALAIKALRHMAAKHVDFLVPNRFEHGYGLSPEIVTLAKNEKQPDLIITVDNGIASVEGVDLARAYGIDVIITDHHLPAATLPNATAIINPNLTDCPFPSKHLAGVGVCFYLFAALRSHLLRQNYFVRNNLNPPVSFAALLDLVAIGTVADVVKLDRNNRILVDAGLKRMREKKCSVGIMALFETARRAIDQAQTQDIAFAVAPRLNAAGRMHDMSYGIACLLTEDNALAYRYAQQLEEFNVARREKQQQMEQQAEQISVKERTGEYSVCVFDANWHEGIVGIVASRLKERYHCPSIVFTKTANGFLKGSARSMPQVHIKDLLTLLDRDHPSLIDRFGGHAMAAGLIIKEKNLTSFKTAFEQAVKRWLKGKKIAVNETTDGTLTPAEISYENAQILQQAGPWGIGFEEPIFSGVFSVLEQFVVAEQHLKLYLKPNNGHKVLSAIAFRQAPFAALQISCSYRLSINRYQGLSSLQLVVTNIAPC